jgi:hypothetical protein
MKVKDLIVKLQEANPEDIVFCPIVGKGYAEADLAGESIQEVIFKKDSSVGKIFFIASIDSGESGNIFHKTVFRFK